MLSVFHGQCIFLVFAFHTLQYEGRNLRRDYNKLGRINVIVIDSIIGLANPGDISELIKLFPLGFDETNLSHTWEHIAADRPRSLQTSLKGGPRC